jgi:hypothetical protein
LKTIANKINYSVCKILNKIEQSNISNFSNPTTQEIDFLKELWQDYLIIKNLKDSKPEYNNYCKKQFKEIDNFFQNFSNNIFS